NCVIDNSGNATCMDPCQAISCPTGYTCVTGTCVDSSCRNPMFPCPMGQKCQTIPGPPMCVPDPCAGVVCTDGKVCDPTAGMCVAPCSNCPNGEICVSGQCVTDACASTKCPASQVCVVVNGMGMCIDNQCTAGCNEGTICCQGMCINDPCATLDCPGSSTCK